MLLRHQLVYDYELYQISIHFPAFQHLFITLVYSTISIRKSPAPAGLFRQTEAEVSISDLCRFLFWGKQAGLYFSVTDI